MHNCAEPAGSVPPLAETAASLASSWPQNGRCCPSKSHGLCSLLLYLSLSQLHQQYLTGPILGVAVSSCRTVLLKGVYSPKTCVGLTGNTSSVCPRIDTGFWSCSSNGRRKKVGTKSLHCILSYTSKQKSLHPLSFFGPSTVLQKLTAGQSIKKSLSYSATYRSVREFQTQSTMDPIKVTLLAKNLNMKGSVYLSVISNVRLRTMLRIAEPAASVPAPPKSHETDRWKRQLNRVSKF